MKNKIKISLEEKMIQKEKLEKTERLIHEFKNGISPNEVAKQCGLHRYTLNQAVGLLEYFNRVKCCGEGRYKLLIHRDHFLGGNYK